MDEPITEGKGGPYKQQVIVGQIYSQIKPEFSLANNNNNNNNNNNFRAWK